MDDTTWTLFDECSNKVDTMLDHINVAFGNIGLPQAAEKLKGLIDMRIDARVEELYEDPDNQFLLALRTVAQYHKNEGATPESMKLLLDHWTACLLQHWSEV